MPKYKVEIWQTRWTFITKRGEHLTAEDFIAPFFDGVAILLGFDYYVNRAVMQACNKSLNRVKTLRIDPTTKLPEVVSIEYKKYISNSNLDLQGFLAQQKFYFYDSEDDF